MRFKEEFGSQFIRADLSNEDAVFGTIASEDEGKIILKHAKIVRSNGKMYSSPEVEIMKSSIVEVHESSLEEPWEEMKDRMVNIPADLLIYLGLAGVMLGFFIGFG